MQKNEKTTQPSENLEETPECVNTFLGQDRYFMAKPLAARPWPNAAQSLVIRKAEE